ncbi:hypothetical protein [Streptomyces laculatispora]|uniref:hypothetical protein n=1 Tax=Streptomyces laculatispora TaxID=887464 RepID=UPI0027DC7AB5|nr:hypothetical protein [Streptomyces laculatispora]
MSREGEVYRQPGALAGQIVRRADAPDQSFSRTQENARGRSDDYDPEDVQFSARSDGGDVVMYLPEITYLDTQQWSVEIGLAPDRLVQLRDAIDNHLRGAEAHAGVGQQPTTVGQQPTVAAPPKGAANDSPSKGRSVAAQTEATVELRARLRAALRRHIDPDDDTMPAIWPGGDFIWLGTDSVIDDLVAAVGAEQLIAERDQAVAAVERVRAECVAIGTPHICNAVDRILGVLDQPKEQP